MSVPVAPHVECEQHHTILPVSDILGAIEFYTAKLGFWLAFKWGEPATMAGVNLGHVQIFLEQGTPNPKGCAMYFVIDDADRLYDFHLARGVAILQSPEDKPWGLREYTVKDLHGYVLTFGHRLLNVGPPIHIERVEVPARLEKRLAGLLYDLAEHKSMSVDSCLEEILLHTCEPLGDGVASPHTAKTLNYIQELKRKHGIDYDSHGSHRFVEDDAT